MARILTGLVGAALVVAAVFGLPTPWFGAFCALIFLGAVWEFQRIARHWSPAAPLALLLATVPVGAALLDFLLGGWVPPLGADVLLLVFTAAALLAMAAGLAVLLHRTPVEQSLAAVGSLCFGTLYFAVPLASLTELHRRDPWLLILTLAIVWFGDAAALYAGRAFGSHRMAPVVSPNKTWEGAAASFLTGVAVAGVWSLLRLDRLDLGLLAVAAAVSCLGQLGDLVESMIKRGARVKDSGHLLPGHGGFFDRLDALLFGAPAMLLGLFLLGP